MREDANQIIPIRWQINGLHQIDWEIIDTVSPNGQISDPPDSLEAKREDFHEKLVPSFRSRKNANTHPTPLPPVSPAFQSLYKNIKYSTQIVLV